MLLLLTAFNVNLSEILVECPTLQNVICSSFQKDIFIPSISKFHNLHNKVIVLLFHNSPKAQLLIMLHGNNMQNVFSILFSTVETLIQPYQLNWYLVHRLPHTFASSHHIVTNSNSLYFLTHTSTLSVALTILLLLFKFYSQDSFDCSEHDALPWSLVLFLV